MAANKGANVFAARATDVSGLVEAARLAVVFSYGVNAHVKTGDYLENLKVVANRDNNYRIKHWDVIADDPNALSIEYGHAFYERAKVGIGPKHPTGNRARPTLIMTKAFALFPGV